MRKKTIITLLTIIFLFTAGFSSTIAMGEDSFANMLVYEESQYYVGRDMQPGEYVLLATSKYDAYFSISTDANNRDRIKNDTFKTNSIITVYSGEYVTLTRCIAVKATDFYSKYVIKTDQEGVMLKVGYDIMPGTYKLKQTLKLIFFPYDSFSYRNLLDVVQIQLHHVSNVVHE